MKNKFALWGLVFVWFGMIYYFTESSMFTGANTASWINEIVQKLQLGHVDHINDGFLSWNYIVRNWRIFRYSVCLRCLYGERYIHGGL
ncbi:hypothetical protein [Parageobacillus toebii]|uniref:hypothetical protein n=1 Tax=Parageobacillus toebii TaxID=153151 RepID=UPI0030842EF9